MNRIVLLTLVAGALVVCRPVTARAEQSVCVLSVREDITHNTLFLVRRAMREADAKRAAALVLDMDTNGGRVDAMEDIIRLLERSPIKTYTFVNQKAYSAGAFISAATDKIFMAPGSVIGAASPVMMIPGQGVQELPKAFEEKLNSAMRALVRSVAQEKGHNPDAFEAMVDADRGLTVDGTEITAKGRLLTLTNEEAAKRYGSPPRPLLSAGTVRDLNELLAKVGLTGAATFEVKPTGFELLGRWLTILAPLLILVGFVAIYLELKAPGLGAPTVVAIVAFGLYFLGNSIAGLAGWEEAALFVVGLALLAVEIFVLPGFGIVGAAGIVAILVALVLAMAERMPSGPLVPAWTQLQGPVLRVGGSFLASVAVMAVLAKFLPKTSLFRKLELQTATSAEAGYTTSRGEAKGLVGATGVADTMLRPSGKGRFGDKIVDVVTEGDLIEKGAAIKIVQVDGARVVVARDTV
jgi:membrane-bound serine protease (ClpP class)